MGGCFLVNKGLANMTDKEHEPDYIIEDDDFFSGGKSVGIKELAIEQYRRCLIEGSKEMVRGGYGQKVVNGKIVDQYIPNQREIFINCVQMLETLLMSNLIKEDGRSKKIKFPEIVEQMEIADRKINKTKAAFFDVLDKINIKAKELNVDSRRNIEQLENKQEMELVNNYKQKLVVLGMLIDKENYFGENSITG